MKPFEKQPIKYIPGRDLEGYLLAELDDFAIVLLPTDDSWQTFIIYVIDTTDKEPQELVPIIGPITLHQLNLNQFK